MAMMEHVPVTGFEQWYVDYDPTGGRQGNLEYRGMAPCADYVWRQFSFYKNEMDRRVANYETLEKLADNQVISPKPDLPNVSSGETAGLVRRLARTLVQNTPNVEVISCFDDDSVHGIFSRYVLTAKVIGSDEYSNDMQQNLFASVKSSLTKGFDCVLPVLLQDAKNGWYIKYDTIHYRDVFPEPGAKDIRAANRVYVRRYLTQSEVHALIANNTAGWDIAALKRMAEQRPRSREMQSVDHETKKHHQIPEGYEVITLYTNTGEPFLTFHANTKMLLRIEQNNHPLKQHPVHFLVLEKDDQQPLGKSQVEPLIGRQDFQDLMLNGAMKLWYRNINPSIIGYGTVNALPNLSPGKYTEISNPNAKIEAFEVNTQTLMQFGQISQQNLGSMVNLIGAPDQQMQQAAGNGMSATPQGVEAQTAVVDTTTNNFQKAIESFFSHYCSYALTIYFQELKAVKRVKPTAEARMKLLEAGLSTKMFEAEYEESDGAQVETKPDGVLELDFEKLATEYWVRCVPGSLVEMEDEKQLRVLNQLFIPLSQAMPALAATQNQEMIGQAAAAMQFIIKKQILLSGAAAAGDIEKIWSGTAAGVPAHQEAIAELEGRIGGVTEMQEEEREVMATAIGTLQDQVAMLTENMGLLLEKLGAVPAGSGSSSPTPEPEPVLDVAPEPTGPTVVPASA